VVNLKSWPLHPRQMRRWRLSNKRLEGGRTNLNALENGSVPCPGLESNHASSGVKSVALPYRLRYAGSKKVQIILYLITQLLLQQNAHFYY
jgi:hypothetical protein